MHYAPRTIAYQCELPHAPSAVDPAPLQRLHELDLAGPAPHYSGFQVLPGGVSLTRPAGPGGALSAAFFLTDRVIVREERTGLAEEEFSRRLVELASRALDARGLTGFRGQQVVVRTLVNLRHYRDSRVFLKQAVFGFEDEVEPFGREPSLYGLRLAFPAAPGEAGDFVLRLESCLADPRSLFIEVQGSFPSPGQRGGLARIGANAHATYRFATERALRFVGRFDARLKA